MNLHSRPVLSERDQASMGPRDQKEPGSPPWCWQTLAALSAQWPRVEDTHAEVSRLLGDLVQYHAWDRIPPGAPYGSLDRMLLEELHLDAQTVLETVTKASETSRKAALATKRDDLLPRGRPDGATVEKAHISPFPKQRDRAAAAGITRRQQQHLDKLARHRVDLLEEVRTGRMSVNAAMTAAGWTPRRQIFYLKGNASLADAVIATLGRAQAEALARDVLQKVAHDERERGGNP